MLYRFIEDNRSEILARVQHHLNKAGATEDLEELTHHVPAFVDEVLFLLKQNAGIAQPRPESTIRETGTRHGNQRQRLHVRIEDIGKCFGAVCDAIFELASERELRFDAREFLILNQSIDTAIAAAIQEYWNQSVLESNHGEFERIGILAHELRNSLSAARLALVALKAGRVGFASATGVMLDRSLGRMESLINKTLASFKSTPTSEPRFRTVVLEELLHDICTATGSERDIHLELDMFNHIEIEADFELLHSAIANLVQNAVKFTRSHGEVIVRVRETGGEVTIEVEDECGGLAHDVSDRMFDPFVQGDAKTSGVGLGLTIARRAVEAHRGQLGVKNIPGKGCVFSMHIPVAHRAHLYETQQT